jgi:hypothetical protein
MFILYKTTNLTNGRFYVGIHEQEQPFEFDGYFGSGKALVLAIKKYGRDNFKRETVLVYNCLQEASIAEAVIVDEEFISSEDTYNIVPGGGYPPVHRGDTHPTKRPEARKRVSLARLAMGDNMPCKSLAARTKMSLSKIGNQNARKK